MTASRVPLAIECHRRLVNGQKGAFYFAAASAASDMEGIPARFITKHWPDSGLGISKFGADWDPRADSAAALIIAAGALRAPHVSLLGKGAVAVVLGQEGFKTAWALKVDHDYQKLADTAEHLWLQPTKGGKEAMAEKLTALCLAVATNETRNPYSRVGLGSAAMFMAISGAMRGEEARQEYVQEIHDMFIDLTDQEGDAKNTFPHIPEIAAPYAGYDYPELS